MYADKLMCLSILGPPSVENGKEITSDGAESEPEDQSTPKPATVPLPSEEEVYDSDTADEGIYDLNNANADLWALGQCKSPTPSQRARMEEQEAEEEEEEEEYSQPWTLGTHCLSRSWRVLADFDNMKMNLDPTLYQICDASDAMLCPSFWMSCTWCASFRLAMFSSYLFPKY